VSCAKTDEPIDLPFGLWTRMGRRKHKFNLFASWRQRGEGTCSLNRPSAAAMRPYVKLLWQVVGLDTYNTCNRNKSCKLGKLGRSFASVV